MPRSTLPDPAALEAAMHAYLDAAARLWLELNGLPESAGTIGNRFLYEAEDAYWSQVPVGCFRGSRA